MKRIKCYFNVDELIKEEEQKAGLFGTEIVETHYDDVELTLDVNLPADVEKDEEKLKNFFHYKIQDLKTLLNIDKQILKYGEIKFSKYEEIFDFAKVPVNLLLENLNLPEFLEIVKEYKC